MLFRESCLSMHSIYTASSSRFFCLFVCLLGFFVLFCFVLFRVFFCFLFWLFPAVKSCLFDSTICIWLSVLLILLWPHGPDAKNDTISFYFWHHHAHHNLEVKLIPSVGRRACLPVLGLRRDVWGCLLVVCTGTDQLLSTGGWGLAVEGGVKGREQASLAFYGV